jgi:hypothetical protein
MKALDQSAKPAAPHVSIPANGPMPFNHLPEEETDGHSDASIEPPPAAARRTLKAKLHHRGHSRPIPISDPQA